MHDTKHASDKKHTGPRPQPTQEQRAAAFRFMLIGAALGFVLSLLLQQILDEESRATVLWHYGRFALIGLVAWCGHLIGIGRGRAVAENVECLAIAVVMALILKHFLVEAYKIPTGSMQPTILGNDESGIFDRVLVNKFAYLLAEPERYDVVVFKYPLDRSKNYIKRLGGLPGEQVSIFNGNLYVAERGADGEFGPDRIARKPRAVRTSVLKRIYPSGREHESLEEGFEALAGAWSVDGDSAQVSADTRFRYGHGESVRDRYLDGYDPDWGIPVAFPMPAEGRENVGDLAIEFDFEPGADCRELAITIFGCGREQRAILGVGAGGARLESGKPNGSDALLLLPVFGDSAIVATLDDTLLSAGSTTRVGFLHVDQELVLCVDGDEVLRFAYEVAGPLDSAVSGIEVEVRGGAARIADVEVHRDIHYTTSGSVKQSWVIPADALFVLGDNTQNSSDGRAWAAQEVRFPDGRSIVTEARQSPSDGYIDIYGERYRFPLRGQPTVRHADGDAYSFVPRNLLLGKAIAVFWPIYPHLRWKLIR